MVGDSWKAHAYPLKQVTIRLQGTRQQDAKRLADLLVDVARRLEAGDQSGHSHDDDFGYAFELVESADGPSVFGDAGGGYR